MGIMDEIENMAEGFEAEEPEVCEVCFWGDYRHSPACPLNPETSFIDEEVAYADDIDLGIDCE